MNVRDTVISKYWCVATRYSKGTLVYCCIIYSISTFNNPKDKVIHFENGDILTYMFFDDLEMAKLSVAITNLIY